MALTLLHPSPSISIIFSFDRIFNRCQVLTPHRHPKLEDFGQAIKDYKSAVYSQTKGKPQQVRKPKAKVLASDQKLLENFRSSNMRLEQNRSDFRAYLPRFLNFIALDRTNTYQIGHEQILFRCLKDSDFPNWNNYEREAIAAYFLALLKYSLSYYPAITVSPSSIILGLIQLEIDLAPYLVYWESRLDMVDSLRHLGALYEW